MAVPPGWDAGAAIGSRPAMRWRGAAWRFHKRQYSADDPGGSIRVSGRYNRGLDQFPPDSTWPALYLGLSYGVCLGEVLRHLPVGLGVQYLREYRLTKLAISLKLVLDCREPGLLGVSAAGLLHDTNYTVGQSLAAAVRGRGCDGMLVPSATRLPDSVLIVFPDLLQSGSSITIVESVDPRLVPSERP